MTCAALVAPAPEAAAAVPARTSGACTTDTGVTVVIDYADLGGGVQVSCVDPFAGDGQQALSASGNTPTGVQRWGLAFICRINGRPGPDEPLAIAGSEGYTEKCINTPPASGFWSYWHAPNGGSWTFSQQGAKNRQAIPGGFEGWRFSLNGSASNPIPPAYRPSHPVTVPQPPAPEQPGPVAPPPATGSTGSTGSTGTSGGPGSTSPGSTGANPAAGGTGSAGADASEQASPSASPSPSESASAATATATSSSAPTSASAKESTPRAAAVAQSTGTPSGALPTVLVLLGLVGLGGVAAYVARRRRRTT